jgi:hypothetical protein
MTDASCPSCGGALISRKIYRMSPVVVTVGYCGLVTAALGILAGLIMIFFGVDRLRGMFLEEMTEPRIEVLRVAGVPESVVRKVAGAETVTADEREGLTDRQLELIARAQRGIEATRAATATAAAAARLNSIIVAVICALAAALSVPLLARRKVLQCASPICTARGTLGRTRAARPRSARRR